MVDISSDSRFHAVENEEVQEIITDPDDFDFSACLLFPSSGDPQPTLPNLCKKIAASTKDLIIELESLQGSDLRSHVFISFHTSQLIDRCMEVTRWYSNHKIVGKPEYCLFSGQRTSLRTAKQCKEILERGTISKTDCQSMIQSLRHSLECLERGLLGTSSSLPYPVNYYLVFDRTILTIFMDGIAIPPTNVDFFDTLCEIAEKNGARWTDPKPNGVPRFSHLWRSWKTMELKFPFLNEIVEQMEGRTGGKRLRTELGILVEHR